MDKSSSPTPQTFGEMLAFVAQQQVRLQERSSEQIAAQNARFETLVSKPPAARKAESLKYHGLMNEDLELCVFTLEPYYHPLVVEESPGYVNMVAYNLASTPMNRYRQFVADCDRPGVIRTWTTFNYALRKRFLPPPDNENVLHE
ncbi:hypothetical protein PF010_g5676 [Phytophthora fragariae]|uniref:Uncharacterized protein n=1 Tax=Phytophthora fragariae TaxID=53985 RepID=A0A6G0LMK5_9STRA|nr:hypothetical protein PF010_g5676 [Phytophthora fragariae]KAE9239644.1 hypothetical protein PF004_g7856 [Phytophthora fragariae]